MHSPVSGGTAVNKTTLSLVGVLNTLGQDGWEVAGFAATEWVNPGRAMKRVEAWTLKRSAIK